MGSETGALTEKNEASPPEAPVIRNEWGVIQKLGRVGGVECGTRCQRLLLKVALLSRNQFLKLNLSTVKEPFRSCRAARRKMLTCHRVDTAREQNMRKKRLSNYRPAFWPEMKSVALWCLVRILDVVFLCIPVKQCDNTLDTLAGVHYLNVQPQQQEI